jgi:hypothetical protein
VLKQHVWTPGTPPRETAPDLNAGTAADGFPSKVAAFVMLSPDGAWGAWTEDHTGEQQQGGSEIPDQYTVEVWAQKPGQPDSRIEFKLPRNTFATDVAWETTGTFLVTVADDPTGVAWHFIRCSVVDRRCEYAPTPGDH